MVLKKGSKGEEVKKLQEALGINADGEFGPNTEKKVKEFQKNNGLTADGIAGPKTLELLYKNNECDINIIQLPIKTHITKKTNRTIKYLVIHYTAGGSSKKGSARKNRDVFLNRSASADFVVDDEEIIQVNGDLKNYYCWAVGDGKGKYGISNSNCISIEICSYLDKACNASSPNHEGWHFSDKAMENAIKLSKYLIKKYNIKFENIVRHYDASRKCCPGIIGWNDSYVYDSVTGKKTDKKNNSDEWIKFKNKLK